jgi:hypothetical protein
MTDRQLEDAVRSAFHDHEHLVDGAGLLDAVQRRVERRRRTGHLALAAAATAVVLAGSSALVTTMNRPGPPPDRLGSAPSATAPPVPVSPAPQTTSPAPVPPGWQAYSSGGLEVTVPAEWDRDNYGCGMDARPSVVGLDSGGTACKAAESPKKEVAIVGRPEVDVPDGHGFLPFKTEIAGEPADRGEGWLRDGRYAGWIRIPGRNVTLSVRTHSEALTSRILASARLVTVDRNGCETAKPAAPRPQPPTSAQFVPDRPAAISVCYYGMEQVLIAGQELTDALALKLTSILNGSRPGPNAARTTPCPVEPLGPEAVVTVRGADGDLATVYVRINGCGERGLDNGRTRAQVTQALIHHLLRPIVRGYSFDSSLP